LISGCMIPRTDLRNIARARLRDSEALFDRGRYDGAIYLCGYAIEVALKARICRTLNWPGFPSTRAEFSDYQSFRTHSLDVLLTLTGIEPRVKLRYPREWSVVATWDPEMRYRSIGTASRRDALEMIESARTLLRVL
jgi:HEPN domain-containing protein